MRKLIKLTCVLAVFGAGLLTAGCTNDIGVGMSVGVPVGKYGYLSMGSSRWF